MQRILFVFFFISLQNIFAQDSNVTFVSKDSQDGLSDNWIRAIQQDEDGYMWFGTTTGLHRYDGVDFLFFPFDYLHINSILVKDSLYIWVGTDVGLIQFNIKTHIYNKIEGLETNAILALAKDKNNVIWVATNAGLVKVSENKFQWFKHSESPNSLCADYISTLAVDEYNQVWVGTQQGISVLNSDHNSFIQLNIANTESLVSNNISAIKPIKKGVWVGTSQGGLTYFRDALDLHNAKKNTFVAKGDVMTLLLDSDNYLWVGKGSGEGMCMVNIADSLEFVIKNFNDKCIKINGLSDNSVYSSFEDKDGGVWFGTYSGGVNFYSKHSKKFHIITQYQDGKKVLNSNLVYSFLEDGSNFWIGTESGLTKWNREKNTHEFYVNIPHDPNSLQGNSVYSLYKDSRDSIWVGCWRGGVQKYNSKTNNFTPVKVTENVLPSIFSITEDSYKNIWLGTVSKNDGLIKVDSNKEITQYVNYKNNFSFHSSNHVLVTKTGIVYASSFRGIDIYNAATNNFEFIPLKNFNNDSTSGPFVSMLLEDSFGNILISSNYGVLKYNPTTKEIEQPRAFLMFQSVIVGLVEDSHNNIWVATPEGIMRFNYENSYDSIWKLDRFTTLDGISANECKSRAIYKDSNGFIYVGTSKGITYFHQDSIGINSKQPQVYITSVQTLENIEDDNSQYIIVPQFEFANDTIVFDFNQNDFIISYAALNYVLPQKNVYAYKLEGYNNDWINAENETQVHYTNLRPGKYTFIVKAANNDGIWCKEEKRFTIIITPPWWQTTYFIVFIIAFVIALIYMIFRVRVAMYRKKQMLLQRLVRERTNEIQEKQNEIAKQNVELNEHRNELQRLVDDRTADLLVAKQKAEEGDRLKTAFLSNLSHEIRTPMNGILLLADLINDTKSSVHEKEEYCYSIKTSANQLLRIVDDVLEISRIETGVVNLHLEPVNVSLFLEEMNSFFAPQAEKKLLQFKLVNGVTKDLQITTDKTKLVQVFTNLISNALKFTSEGFIEIGCLEIDDILQFYVKDTGIGIPKKLHKKIFERFRQAEMTTSRTYGGTGLGLAISEKLIQMLGGNIWIDSEKDNGATFYFTLPKK